MRLPSADRSIIDAAKIRDYLLSLSHPVGRLKAIFFLNLGYSQDEWSRLAADLRKLALSNEAVPGQVSPYGQKYQVRGTLTGPRGHAARIVTVWIVLVREDLPRFVTAYPES